MKYLRPISTLSLRLLALVIALQFGLIKANAIEKRALLVGIGAYGSDTEWSETHGDHDAKVMAEEIESIGFNNYTKLINNEATKVNIIAQLNQLYDSCNVGDIILFYFAGHGQLILDYNADEQDGYDESLVLYNAPRYYDAVYNNEHHLLDEELSEIINRFRIKLGAEGQFLLVVDAGFGWSTSAGVHLYERGGALPLEANTESHRFDQIGRYEVGIIDDQPFSVPSDGYATLFHVSANDIKGTARESNGNGVLTLAVTRSLEELNDSTDFEQWFTSIKSFSLEIISTQIPLAEGDGAAIVFDLYNKVEGSDYASDYATTKTNATLSDEEINILSDLKDRLIEEYTNDAGNPDFGTY